VYNTLGFGFLEPIYMSALERDLRSRGHRVGREVWVTVYFRGDPIGKQRIDMVVDETLVIEAKSSLILPQVAPRQLYNYLCASDLQVGLLLHFGPQPRFYRMVSTRGPTKSDRSAVSAESD